MRTLTLAALALAAPAAGHAQQVAVVRGVVHDSLLTGRPLAAATVWFHGTDHAAETDSVGRFRLEGVRPGRYRAAFFHPSLDRVSLTAPVLDIEVTGDGGTLDLATPSARAAYDRLCPGRHPKASGVIVGVVRGQDAEAPLPGARVVAEWTSVRMARKQGLHTERVEVAATTRDDGSYVLCDVPADVPVLVRTELDGRPRGHVPAELDDRPFAVLDLDLDLADGEAGPVRSPRFALTRSQRPQLLPELTTTADIAVDPRGFDARRLSGRGGYFFTREDMAKRRVRRIGDLFATIPGMRLVYDPSMSGQGNTLVFSKRAERGPYASQQNCRPLWYVNGVHFRDLPDDYFRADDLLGVEVYTTMASVPIEYQRPGFECGVILVWSRPDLR